MAASGIQDISIHAPAKGATQHSTSSPNQQTDFNPRSREGSDDDMTQHKQDAQISIHAPAKGATRQAVRSGAAHAISIHAPAKGATTPKLIFSVVSKISIHAPAKGATTRPSWSVCTVTFQSTLPRRERPLCTLSANTTLNFNPRSREGSDLEQPQPRAPQVLFQSTLPRRERRPAA